ncbi:hypothetical protein F4778DRAFT_611584 [Xylariomycetidae sp. FL2044]|nr:hypothetical protein F4778DRAFT_611584 [Xylariomycetidae sp. FL2044]
MPAVHKLQPPTGNVTLLPSIYRGQLRLLYDIAATLLGLSLLGALRFVSSRKHKSPVQPTSKLSNPLTIDLQRRFFQKESRGVSFTSKNMSDDRNSRVSQFRSDGNPDEAHAQDAWESHDGYREAHDMSFGTGQESWEARTSGDLKSGPPQPPPLTPPTLETGLFTFQDRRPSTAVSATGHVETSPFHHSNTDYASPDSLISASTAMSNDLISPATPGRKSNSKISALGSFNFIPTPTTGSDKDRHPYTFSPSSFPSSSPILPIAPHQSLESENDVRDETAPEIDGADAIWKRHTRVYGGGVCLACLASGEEHHGGFYGDNVPMSERR